eukprot:15430357-Alexandrium_andersonii.AAC.1
MELSCGCVGGVRKCWLGLGSGGQPRHLVGGCLRNTPLHCCAALSAHERDELEPAPQPCVPLCTNSPRRMA